MVLYNPSVIDAGEAGNVPDPTTYQIPSSSRKRALPNQMPRVIPCIGAFTVQCANCFKWRLIPTKEKYEEIREHIMEQPFFCETGQEWKPNLSCEDPPDITQDGSRLWAIDKPSIAQPPPGWQRLLRIRAEGGTKFADVSYVLRTISLFEKLCAAYIQKWANTYYLSPTGKRLRSMVEVERYLHEHPEYIAAGISLAKFSFQIPKPLQENYVRKRLPPPRPAPTNDPSDLHSTEVLPISWTHLEPDTDVHLGRPHSTRDADVRLSRPSSSANYLGSTGLMPEAQAVKKQKSAA